MRKECTRLVGKSLEMKQVEVLTCPRCGQEEILNKKRARRRFDIQAVLYDTGNERAFAWDDICSKCMREFLGWMQSTTAEPPDDSS